MFPLGHMECFFDGSSKKVMTESRKNPLKIQEWWKNYKLSKTNIFFILFVWIRRGQLWQFRQKIFIKKPKNCPAASKKNFVETFYFKISIFPQTSPLQKWNSVLITPPKLSQPNAENFPLNLRKWWKIPVYKKTQLYWKWSHGLADWSPINTVKKVPKQNPQIPINLRE